MSHRIAPAPILPRIGETQPDSGLGIPGQYVWCSSVIQAEGKWHMFSAVWPERTDAARYSRRGVLQEYLQLSTIVRAEADSPEGPYTVKETALRPRGSGNWDVVCCHNPCIVRVGSQYALFFQTCGEPGEPRRIGCAVSDQVTGSWVHAESAIPFKGDAVNPSVWVESDGSLLVAYRTKPMKLSIARSPGLYGPWEVANENIMPHYEFEDPSLFYWHNQYHMVVEDAKDQVTGDMRNGIRLASDNGIHWDFYKPEIRAYGGLVRWTNGTSAMPVRRERPSLILQDGEPTHLVNSVLFSDGETYTGRSIVTPLT